MASLLLLSPGLLSAHAQQVDVQEIIARSAKVTNADWNTEPQYDYSDSVKQNGHTRTYDELMVLGSRYERLIAVDGKPLTGQQKSEQQQKLDQVIAQRRAESPAQRSQRIANWDRSRKRNHLLVEQLTKAFDFKLEGTPTLNGREVYELSATPRPGYQPPNNHAKVLTGMVGTLWIDQKTFQWVKVEAKVIHPVSIEGFLARVDPGTRFELEQAPVDSGVWLPTFFSVRARAKVFFLFSHNSQEEDTFSNYRKTSTENIPASQ
ncbi:MAG TPA: hypothetical protein VMF56_10150 [Acidobacteriaceae bacterium]|nr:hypothetical protein [Acidobacteriaceae bacterium]